MTPALATDLSRILFGWGLLAASHLVLACSPPPLPANAGPYEDCAWGDGTPCREGTTQCLPKPFPEEPGAFDSSAGYCSLECMGVTDCPTLPGVAVVCELYEYGRFCTVRCNDDDDCPRGTTCDELDRGNEETVRRCMP
jgi:hypothetical protein